MGRWKIKVFRGGFLRLQWFFAIVAGNGEVVAQSEGYKNKRDCLNTIDRIRVMVVDAEIVDEHGEVL